MAENSQEVQPAAAAAAPELLVCKLCGLGYAVQQGRLHGKTFKCVSCDTHDRALRRNLGTQNDLQQWSVEETQTFFRQLAQKKSETVNGRLQWTTVRAALITSMTERTVQSYKGKVECSELPLSVYVQQG